MSDADNGELADDKYTTEPVGGGAQSTPDPTAPGSPGHEPSAPEAPPDDPGAEPSSVPPAEPDTVPRDELGGEDTVQANDELQGGAER